MAHDKEQTLETWRRLVRRSFGIPDIVRNSAGDQLICNAMFDEVRQLGSRDVKRSDVKAMLAAVVKAGTSGDLDAFLVGLPDQAVEDVIEWVAKRSKGVADTEAMALVKVALRHIRAFVDDHPFQADCGCHFN